MSDSPDSPFVTFEEAERNHDRAALARTFAERLQLNEEMCRLTAHLLGAAGGPELRRHLLSQPENAGLLAYLSDADLAAPGFARPPPAAPTEIEARPGA